MGSGVVPACRCCTTACTTSSARRGSSGKTTSTVQVQVQAVHRSVHLPWSARAPCLSLHSGCSGRDSAGELRAPAFTRLSSGLPRLPKPNKVVANSVPDLAEARPDIEEGEEESIAEDADVGTISEWELDFCSRPILDGRGKKLWELVVCDSKRQLQFTRFFPNNVINSVTLRDALLYIMETLEVPKPEKIRFFRSQMQTIITKACKELDIQPVPSQRCVTLIKWLEERNETVYTQHPGYQEGASPLLLQQAALPLDLPDALRGEEWAFVQLPFDDVLEELDGVLKGEVFGSVLDLDTLKINLTSDVMIPGVAVASSRATPLAAWTNALEIASLEVDTQRSCLVLSTGVSDRWRYAFYRKSRQTDAEGEAWEAAKKKCGGLHFLAVQESLDSELCTGFWLLIDTPMSPV